MTISSETRKAGPFNGNDATTSFPFTFKVFAKTDIRVVLATPSGTETDLVLDSDYSVTLNGDQDAAPGGTITYPISGDALATGWTLTAVGDIDALQPTDLTNQGGFYPQVIENALDRATILVQQLQETDSRTIQLPVSDSSGDVQLPPAASRAGRVLGFDASGNLQLVEVVEGSEVAIVNRQKFTATAAQTDFITSFSFVPGVNAVSVFLNGSKLVITDDYLELDDNTIRLNTGATVSDTVEVISTGLAAGVADQVEQNAIAAGISEVNAAASEEAAAASAAAASASANAAAGTYYVATKAAGDTLAASLLNGATVIVTADESQGGVRVRYTVASAALTAGVVDTAVMAQWERTVLSKSIATVQDAIDTTGLSIWEFAYLATGYTLGGDPSTWDWSPALQAAINSLPLNTANTGIMTPNGFANGGAIRASKGRYKLGSKVTMQRGVHIAGESRESTQFVSFTAGTVFEYLDSGRAYPDEIVFSNLSIWQDSSVVSTSGAAIRVVDGPASVQAVFFRADNVLINATYKGIVLSAGIGCSVRDSMVNGTVSDGIEIIQGVGFTQTTSVSFENVYCASSQTGSGFKLTTSAYVAFTACASDSNARYGYELLGTAGIQIHGGAESNGLGGVYLFQCRGTNVFATIVDNVAGNSDAVTLDQSSGTVISGVHSSGAGATGFSIKSVAAGTGATFTTGLIRTGGWNNAAQRSSATHALELNLLSGFVGGIKRQWAFGTPAADSLKQLYNTGSADSTVTDGFVTDVALAATGTVSSAHVARAQTQSVAVTWAVLNGMYAQAPIKGALSTVTRYNGVLIDESSIGANANTNVAIGTASPPAGSWNVYSASTRDSVWLGKHRFVSSTGPTIDFGTGSPEGVKTAPVGSMYGRTDGGAGTSFYVKESGTGNTGWVAK